MRSPQLLNTYLFLTPNVSPPLPDLGLGGPPPPAPTGHVTGPDTRSDTRPGPSNGSGTRLDTRPGPPTCQRTRPSVRPAYNIWRQNLELQGQSPCAQDRHTENITFLHSRVGGKNDWFKLEIKIIVKSKSNVWNSFLRTGRFLNLCIPFLYLCVTLIISPSFHR